MCLMGHCSAEAALDGLCGPCCAFLAGCRGEAWPDDLEGDGVALAALEAGRREFLILEVLY